jgi:hypothetical protein
MYPKLDIVAPAEIPVEDDTSEPAARESDVDDVPGAFVAELEAVAVELGEIALNTSQNGETREETGQIRFTNIISRCSCCMYYARQVHKPFAPKVAVFAVLLQQ